MRRNEIALCAAVGLAAALRLYGIGELYPLDDEFIQLFTATHPQGPGDFLELVRERAHHLLLDPLVSFLLGRWTDSMGWLRLPSALWGVAGVFAVWRLGSRSGDSRLALAASCLLSISLMHVEWSRRVNLHALSAALSLFHSLAFLRLLDRPQAWRGYLGWTILFLYAHPYAILSGILHGLFLLLAGPGKNPSTNSSILRGKVLAAYWRVWRLGVALLLPWFFYSARMLSWRPFDFQGTAGSPTAWEFLSGVPLHLAQATEVYAPLRGWGPPLPAVLACGYALLYLSSLLALLRKKASHKQPPAYERLLQFSHLAVPFGIASVTLIDMASGYFFAYRQLIWILPYYLLTVAHGGILCLEAALHRRPWAVRPAAALLLSLVVGAAAPLYTEASSAQIGLQRGFDRISEFVRNHARPEDRLVFADGELAFKFLHRYDPPAFRRCAGRFLTQERRYGNLDYLPPPGLRAGPHANAVQIGPSSNPGRPREGRNATWYFEGSIEELFVYPPLRPRRTTSRRPKAWAEGRRP